MPTANASTAKGHLLHSPCTIMLHGPRVLLLLLLDGAAEDRSRAIRAADRPSWAAWAMRDRSEHLMLGPSAGRWGTAVRGWSIGLVMQGSSKCSRRT